MSGGRLTGRILPVEDVTDQQREQMFALMEQYYAGMRRDVFEADLREKSWVIQVIEADTGAVRGFSTQQLLQVPRRGGTVLALFSGDTIIDRACWARNPLSQVWGRFALELIDRHPSQDLYWFLITKGFRTYRFLPVFFREFYPRRSVMTPPWAKETIDLLARAKFAAAYDADAGLVRAAPEQCHLRGEVGEVTATRLTDPDICYFVERNPGHAQGDELCCLAPLTRANFTEAAYRIIGKVGCSLRE